MAKNLLIICQKVDEADDLLGFFVSWMRAFSQYFERVDVITLSKGVHRLPANVHVHSLGKERGAWKILQIARLKLFLWRHTPRNGAVFAHMSPIFAIAAWPLAKIRHAKLVLWYLHRSNTQRLRIALALCDRLVTADARSLTIENDKIVSVGHGIDVDHWQAQRGDGPIGRALRMVSVGRISPIKDYETLIRAAGLLKEQGFEFELRIVGRAIMAGDHSYEKNLRALVNQLGLREHVRFIGFVPYNAMVVHYAWADAVVGCTPRGGLDKALLEGMAAGCVPFTSNDAMFASLQPYDEKLIFPHGDFRALADVIVSFHDWPGASRALVEQVRKHHNLHTTIKRISDLL